MKIKLSNIYDIFILKNIQYDKKELLAEIYYNNEISRETKETSTKFVPGIQSDLIINTKNILLLKKTVFDNFCKIYNFSNDIPYHSICWAYISTPYNTNTGFHTHLHNSQLFLKNNYAWAFYTQMPTSLKDDEGKIIFKTEDEKIHRFLPEEGDLFFFPAGLQHKPELNLNSEVDRVVVAGNFCILDLKTHIKKKTKTLV